MLYNILTRMIERKNTNGLEVKIDVFYAYNKITKEEYDKLIKMLNN